MKMYNYRCGTASVLCTARLLGLKRDKNNGAVWERNADVMCATDSALDILLNGYANLWALLDFVFYSQWLSYLSYAHTVATAVKTFLLKKSNFEVFWKAFYVQVLRVLIKASAEVPDARFAAIMQHLDEVNTFIRLKVLPAISNT